MMSLNELEQYAYQNANTPLEKKLYEYLKKYIDLVEVLNKHNIPSDPETIDKEITKLKKYVNAKDNLIDDMEDVLRDVKLPLDVMDKLYTVLERYY